MTKLLVTFTSAVQAFLDNEDAQDVVEYGMLIASIVIVVLICTTAFGNQIKPWFQALAARITTVGT